MDDQSEDPRQRMQVMMTHGVEDLARAVFALETALTAAVSGIRVQVFLTLAASEWACEPRRGTAARVYERIDQLIDLGVEVLCCSACATEQCDPGRRVLPAAVTAVLDQPTTHRRIRLAGLTAFVEGVVAGVPTLTF